MARKVKVIICASIAIFAILLLTQNLGCSEAMLKTRSYWKPTPSSRYSYIPIGSKLPKSRGPPAPRTHVYTPMTANPGTTYVYTSPPQPTPSGLVLGGVVILGEERTKTHTREESAPAEHADKFIIINNGPPVPTANPAGATVITIGVFGENATQPMPAPAPTAAPADPAIPNVSLAPIGNNKTAQHPPSGLICVRVRVNDTDPADSSKMIEVEKIACYPAPVTGAEANGTAPVMPPASEGSAPLAPMSTVTAASQQLQANPTQAPLLPVNASVKTSGAWAWLNYAACNSMTTVLLPLYVAIYILNRVY